MQDKKSTLINGIKPLIREMAELTKSFDNCIEQSSRAGNLNVDAAVTAMKLLLPLQTKLIELIESTCHDLGDFGISMIGYVNFQFKASVQALVEALKIAIQTQDLSKLTRQVADFRNHPKALIDLLKNANSVDSEIAKNEQLLQDKTDSVTKPAEVHLPKLVLLITEYSTEFGKTKMVEGIKAYFALKEILKGVAFVKVRRNDGRPIDTREPDIAAIISKFDLEELRGVPVFVMIKNNNYYWFRNTVFKTNAIFNWIDDILNDLAYITGIIPWNNIPENIKYFWKDKGHLTEPLSKVALKIGSPVKNNLIQMGEAPDIWNELWFVAISEEKTMIFLESLIQFQNKFQRMLDPITVKPWTYKYIVPTLDWPGWTKLSNLDTLPIEKRQIETALAPLKEYIIIKDQKNVPLSKSQFYIFFEGEPEVEEEINEKPEFDLAEFGDIGTINVNWSDLDNLETPGKWSKKPATGTATKSSALNKPVVAPKPTIKTASTTVQDQIFDYLGEMLKNNVLADGNEEEHVSDDIDLDNL